MTAVGSGSACVTEPETRNGTRGRMPPLLPRSPAPAPPHVPTACPAVPTGRWAARGAPRAQSPWQPLRRPCPLPQLQTHSAPAPVRARAEQGCLSVGEPGSVQPSGGAPSLLRLPLTYLGTGQHRSLACLFVHILAEHHHLQACPHAHRMREQEHTGCLCGLQGLQKQPAARRSRCGGGQHSHGHV